MIQMAKAILKKDLKKIGGFRKRTSVDDACTH